MEPKKFIILGSIVSLISIVVLIWLLSLGMIKQVLYSTFQVKGDYWVWGYILIPILFFLLGIYYFYIGVKKRNTNGWISASVIIQLIAVLIGAFGFLYPTLFRIDFGYLITLILGIPTSILMVIGIILLLIGKIILWRESA